jgi:hypothetical protein
MNKPRQDLATIEAELAAEAARVSDYVGQPDVKKITVDRDGNFVAAGGEKLGNEIHGCIVDFCSANDYYTSAWDPNNPKPPVCFARGRVIADMVPEETSPEPQAESCAVCPHNVFGSRGNGKACKNTRNLAFVLAEDLERLQEGEVPDLHLISVSPTALASFDAMVKQCARLYSGPPIKAIVSIKAVSKGTYTALQFGNTEPNPYFVEVFPLRDAALDIIGKLPNLDNYVPTKGRR